MLYFSQCVFVCGVGWGWGWGEGGIHAFVSASEVLVTRQSPLILLRPVSPGGIPNRSPAARTSREETSDHWNATTGAERRRRCTGDTPVLIQHTQDIACCAPFCYQYELSTEILRMSIPAVMTLLARLQLHHSDAATSRNTFVDDKRPIFTAAEGKFSLPTATIAPTALERW